MTNARHADLRIPARRLVTWDGVRAVTTAADRRTTRAGVTETWNAALEV